MKYVNKKVGIIVFLILLLASCVKTEYVYKEVERETIDCDLYIKTPLDMANCITEFRQRW